MYLFPNHQENFKFLLQKDGTHPNDIERKALFYILAGYEEITNQVDLFYDFQDRMIRIEDDEIATLSSSGKALVQLGYNLYNNYPCGTVLELFRNLDMLNVELAINAINIRFRKTELK
ncbi:DUF6075 family protein [Niallia sp. FSL W8-0954]|jgi:Family of unknown function (DUF6075)|uniref:DUF6075 family protein n=1 Tax=Niallia sp. FSL W8-0954 TaxID=2975338 RepID=UPI0030F8EEFF